MIAAAPHMPPPRATGSASSRPRDYSLVRLTELRGGLVDLDVHPAYPGWLSATIPIQKKTIKSELCREGVALTPIHLLCVV